jgi:hypothetical protein
MATIYRKTDKGRAEIDTRAHRLVPRLRNALILVDGKRSGDDLRGMLGAQADDTLQALATDGFVEATATAPAGASAAAPAGASAAAPAAAPAVAAGPASRPPGARAPSFEVQRREAVRALTDTVGPMVAEMLALRMEKASDAIALHPLLEQAVDLIRNVRGAGSAAAYAERFVEHS